MVWRTEFRVMGRLKYRRWYRSLDWLWLVEFNKMLLRDRLP